MKFVNAEKKIVRDSDIYIYICAIFFFFRLLLPMMRINKSSDTKRENKRKKNGGGESKGEINANKLS